MHRVLRLSLTDADVVHGWSDHSLAMIRSSRVDVHAVGCHGEDLPQMGIHLSS